jgi:phage tail sheath gpL-like
VAITTTAYPQDRKAPGVAIGTEYKQLGAANVRFRPSRIAVIGQGNDGVTYSTDKRQVFGQNEAGDLYGYGSPVHLAVSQLLPINGDGVGSIPVTVYPLADPAGTASAGTVTPSGTVSGSAQRYVVKINNIRSLEIAMTDTQTVADFTAAATIAINGVPEMPVTASDGTTVLNLAAKYTGTMGDEIVIEIESPDGADITFVVVQPTGGVGAVDITTGLTQFGDVWESHIVNCADANTTNFDEYSTFGEGRWEATTAKPLVCVSGIADTFSNATAITDARKTDRVNCLVNVAGGKDLPYVIAGRAVARCARVANVDPARDYVGQTLTGLVAGADSDQFTDAQNDSAQKLGLSTTVKRDGVLQINQLVTMYHPTGEDPAPYAYIVDIQKLSAMIYSIDLIFRPWLGDPLVPNDQAISSTSAKKPRMALARLGQLYDSAGLAAIISDPDYAKENSQANIGTTNPKRLDILAVFKLSGNANVISIDQNFGFYFGGDE